MDAIVERAKKYQPKPKVTYNMIQEYVEKKYGFKVHTAYIAEVKRLLDLTTYDAPNAVEELKQSRKRPPKEKAEAITEAYTQDFENEFISLTDIARYKSDDPTAVMQRGFLLNFSYIL